MNTKALYIAWQDPESREWRPVGRLTHHGRHYYFVYTKGAQTATKFQAFGNMTDLTATYESRELFPLFANRLLSKERPEYKSYLEWLNIPAGKDEPLMLLARTGGIRGTDTLTVFPEPSPKDGKYYLEFFSHGIRYLSQEIVKLIETLQPSTKLYLMLDVQNEVDLAAIALRAERPAILVGYVPRFYTNDFRQLLHSSVSGSVNVLVERVNPDAPLQLRLLCSITSEWPTEFRPCSGEMYEPIPEVDIPQLGNMAKGKFELT